MISWELLAIFFLLVLYIKNFSSSNFMLAFALFQFAMIVITLFEIGGIGQGLKKLFVYPFACVVIDLWSKKNPGLLLKGLLYVLFFEELLNTILWNFNLFAEGVYFVGIRTAFPVIGFLTVFVAFLCIYLRIPNTRYISYISVFLVVLSILRAKVSTGIVGLIVLFFMIIFIRFKLFEKLVNFCDNKKLIPVGILINVAVVFFGAQERFSFFITQFLGESIYMNGRTVIWSSALSYISKKPILGYGVYGVYFPVSWGSLNYCHTQSLQLLLDGGIVLLILFLCLIFFVGKGIDSCEDYSIRKVATICLFCCFIMMIAEVFTFYMWFFILITIMSNLKEYEKLKQVSR